MADQSPINNNVNIARLGLNLDSTSDQINQGELRYALNAQVENFDGNIITYQNEQANVLCVTLPTGYKVIGVKNVQSANKVIYFLVNPITEVSEIGYSEIGKCDYTTLVSDENSDSKFNFSINYPIHKVVIKVTNCSTQLYWTDGYNPRRYIDLDDLPWKEVKDPNNDFKFNKQIGILDANKLLVQPNFSVPYIDVEEVTIGGKLKAGAYQFAIQYANSLGEGYTSYYNPTNPLSIFENNVTPNFDFTTSKAITLDIKNLDTTGLYEYFNIAVIKTINNIPSVEKIASALPIQGSEYTYTYTGSDETAERLTITDIFEKFPYYEVANDIFEVDNVLGWADLKDTDEINYQEIWSKVSLQWETTKIPYTEFEAYNNGINTEKYRGYMRDEVYAFEGCFLLKNGRQTRSFHIPGRIATQFDLDQADWGNDNAFSDKDNCTPPDPKPRWEVYNTGSVVGFSDEYINKTTADDCYVGPYQYGEFSYWESIETYPKNPTIWGDLAGKPIRHHKFPDLLVTRIYDADSNGNTYVYPIGVRIDINSLYDAIAESNLSQDDKDQIVGFKLVRGNRANNKSVIAKGLLHNVGRSKYYDTDNETIIEDFLYPNYPYNDLRRDPYFASTKLVDHEGFNYNRGIEGFYDDADASRSRFTFHSPDTHFVQPSLSNQGEYLKLETVEYGISKGHFVKVKDNAEYKFLTRNTVYAAAGLGAASGLTIGAGQFGWPEYSLAPVASTFTSAQELFEKLVPYTNFGYSFTSIGTYTSSFAIPNDGYKNRQINYNRYLTDGFNAVENGNTINNFHRESSVYINTDSPFKFTHEYSAIIPQDVSRYNLASLSFSTTPIPPGTLTNPGYKLKITEANFSYIVPGQIYTIAGVEYVVVSDTMRISSTGHTSGGFFRYSGEVLVKPVIAGSSAPNDPFKNAYISTNSPNPTIAPSFFEYESYTVVDLSPTSDGVKKNAPELTREKDISSYYGAIKKYLPGQWGRMYSYESIETGYYQPLYDDLGNTFSRVPIAYGGDIYINRFAYKSKLPVFRDNSVFDPNQADIAYDELGNVAYPMFWLSTKPSRFDIDIRKEVEDLADEIFDAGFFDIFANIVGGGAKGSAKAVKLLKKLFEEVYNKVGIKNVNFDEATEEGICELGKMYLFIYGIPYFFCESEINVDYRQAYNELEGNFFPNVTNDIPDEWLQEKNVPIKQDNTYYYNFSFSKQNKENYFSHLREDYDPNDKCFTYFPNRAIWSDPSSLEETKNNWLIYRPAARHDLPKVYGTLTSIDNIENKQLLVRFTNHTQIYNALTTVQVSAGPQAYLGNDKLFSGLPLDIAKTDIGYAGSQHKLLIKTEYGQVFVDAIRGQIILFNNGQITELSNKGLDKWFTENLPFHISSTGVPIDNCFNGIGLSAIYDSLYQRIIITKLDYKPLYDLKWDGIGFIDPSMQFPPDRQPPRYSLTDENYFQDKSWTLSYCLKTQSWISFHSYTPNYYIPFATHFQSGLNSEGTTWNHNKTFFKFHNFYNTQYPYILEYPFAYRFQDEILQNVKEYCTTRMYDSYDTYYEPDETVYFNKAIIYNDQQCSGLLNLVPKPRHNLSVLFGYPKYNTSSKDILVTKSDNFYNYNTFWNINTNNNQSFFTTSDNLRLTDKELKDSNLDYTSRDYKKGTIRGKNLRIRHILDNRSDVKLISRFIVNNTVNSYK